MDEQLDGVETPEEGGNENRNIQLLREKAKRYDDLEAKAAQLERKMAFMEAGVDTSTPLGAMFAKAYDGDVSNVEALKSAAQEVGVQFVGATAPVNVESQESEVPEESSGTQARRDLANNAPADEGVSPDPRQVAMERYQEALKKGRTHEDAMGLYVNTVASGAMSGDRRVILDQTGTRPFDNR